MSFLPVDRVPGLLTAPVRVTGSVVTTAVSTAAGVTGKVAATAADAVRATAGAALEAVGGTPVRRVSRDGGDFWIEVRGLDLAYGPLELALTTGLGRLPGVTDVTVIGPLDRVIVNTDGSVATESVVAAIDEAENAVAARIEGVGVPVIEPAPLPGDSSRAVSSLLGTAAAGAAAVGAAVTAALPVQAFSRLLAAPVTALDYHPAARSALNDALGAQGADLLLRSVGSAANLLTGAPVSALVSAGLGAVETREARNAQQAWAALAPALTAEAGRRGSLAPPPGAQPRAATSYSRPYEKVSANAGLAAAAVIGVVGTLEQAAEAVMVGAPKAARTVRETFAAAVSRGLHDHHDALVMNPRALRGLSEIDTLLVDPRALFTEELRISRITGVDGEQRTAAWHEADAELSAGRLSAGWNTVDTTVGTVGVLVAPVFAPLAPVVLMEARKAGLRILSLADEAYGTLHQAFDDLFPADDDVDAALARVGRRLADDGHTVALLAASGTQAPTAVAFTVGLFDEGTPVPWNADVLVRDLAGAWRILHAVPAAVAAAERGMTLSVGGSVLGTLMLIPDVPGDGPGSTNTSALFGFRAGHVIGRRVFDAPVPPGETDYDWHAMPITEVARRLPPPERAAETPAVGLAALTGRPAVTAGLTGAKRVRDYLREFGDTMREDLNDPITPILATGAAASALLGSPLDAAMVGSVLALNTALSAQQSLHAERLLRRMLAEQDPLARRISGFSDRTEYEEIRASRLLPGDIIEVRSGEVVPADGRIIDAEHTEVDESALTGESLPVDKDTRDTPGAPLAERTGMLYAGTTMVAGKAHAIVTAVGASTQASRALAMAPRPSREVGLAAQLGEITERAMPWSFAGGAAIGAFSLLRRRPLREVASGTVSIAVAAVPEGLPLVVTLAQSASARRLTGSSVLVRNSRAIEAFARLDAVCFDKTGTLSENRLRVDTVVGLGEDPVTGLRTSETEVLTAAGETMLVRRDGSVEHATDAAIHAAAGDAGIVFATPDALLPFQSERPYAGALIGNRVMVKGAPETLMPVFSEADRVTLRTALDELAAKGLRVLAVADCEIDDRRVAAAVEEPNTLADAVRSLRLLGVIGLSDTPRPAAEPLITELLGRGLEVRMITGDHPVTAAAIAGEMGLTVTADQVMTGDRWDRYTSSERVDAARRHLVFARMSPEHKVQVVQALEDAGLVTAMVGDGANDAAAIRAASVGIGVASAGSDPARIAADVMLLDGDISGIIDALDEGEQLWRRVLSAISVLLGHSVGELSFGLITTMLTGRPALNARQMMLVNMLTDAFPAAALAVSPQRDPDVQGAHDESTIYRAVAVRAVFTTLGAVIAWSLASMTGRQSRAATVGLVGLVASQMLEMLVDSDGPLVLATNIGTFALMGTIVSIPGLSHLFGCTPIGPMGWAQAMIGATAAASIAKLLPGVIDELADRLPQLTEKVGGELAEQLDPILAALKDAREEFAAAGADADDAVESVVDDEDARTHEDGVDVLDGGREEPDADVDESVGSQSTSEFRHG
ncbi:MAG: cation-translocating P-type ATPase [Gordonia sp. (in: high G+C Gram-positive bacteria)]|uniref:cation-translocating P-type ATPase n=1 Tax=Gordonia sp. (in: high G+C Gram-positive bacteria) TaxID=84139 RepID=UPI0039E4A5E8